MYEGCEAGDTMKYTIRGECERILSTALFNSTWNTFPFTHCKLV